MQRINTLLQKINDLASKDKDAGVIDIDLMMDYTRVLYADLLEWRARVSFNTSLEGGVTPAPPVQPVQNTMPEKPTDVKEVVAPAIEEQAENMAEEPVVKPPEINIPKPAADIRKWIGINDKYQFISEMFGNDKDAYEMVMNQINESSDYSAAIDMLDDIHAERGWNDEEITIQSFYGILSKFFSER